MLPIIPPQTLFIEQIDCDFSVFEQQIVRWNVYLREFSILRVAPYWRLITISMWKGRFKMYYNCNFLADLNRVLHYFRFYAANMRNGLFSFQKTQYHNKVERGFWSWWDDTRGQNYNCTAVHNAKLKPVEFY